jgi:hypothetical protein
MIRESHLLWIPNPAQAVAAADGNLMTWTHLTANAAQGPLPGGFQMVVGVTAAVEGMGVVEGGMGAEEGVVGEVGLGGEVGKGLMTAEHSCKEVNDHGKSRW